MSRIRTTLIDHMLRQHLKTLFDAAQPPSWVWAQIEYQAGAKTTKTDAQAASNNSSEPPARVMEMGRDSGGDG